MIKYIFKLTTLLLVTTIVQGQQSRYLSQSIFENRCKIDSLKVHNLTIAHSDSLESSPVSISKENLRYKEYFNKSNQVLRGEYYSKGKINMAFSNTIQSGVITETIADTNYHRNYIKKTYEHLDSFTIKTIKTKEGEVSDISVVVRDSSNNCLAKYYLSEKQDTLAAETRFYDNRNNLRYFEFYTPPDERITIVKNYTQNGQLIRWYKLNENGEMAFIMNMSYPDKHTEIGRTEYTDGKDSEVTTTKKFYDKHGNMYKQLTQSRKGWYCKYLDIYYNEK